MNSGPHFSKRRLYCMGKKVRGPPTYLDHDPVPEHVAQFAQEVYQLQLMMCLLVVLPRLEFEVRASSLTQDT